ncbi:autotransporter-associated beta strand repeat-containing protein [Verrucomicrobium sp. GAS474]|uniref:beta strand repeat-containing protein n=1 Tax=Verrucomicrobium sp. GAS474 TaxID=1882831 RepID=UPI0008792F9B|nr:PEP-CTERM sorting domain-containing protein [Verrucomicrobium sp. GAS474]SDT93964.1 autotransporter-associated beta strand repeat-containing protein [Verrucomicrobium sp. GAS474]
MKKRSLFRSLSARKLGWVALFCVAGSGSALAQWTGTSSGLLYETTANWNGGVINDVFSNNLGLNQTVKVSASRTVSGLTFSYGDAFALTILPATGTGYTLTLNGDVYQSVGGSSSNLTVTLGNSTSAINLDLGGATRTFNINPATAAGQTSADTLAVYGTLSNGNLLKTGIGGLTLNSNSSTLTGSVTVNQGLLTLATANGAMTGISGLAINSVPSTTANYLGEWGEVILDNSAAVNNNRLSSTAPITLDGGALVVKGNSSAAVSQAVGSVSLVAGLNVLGVVPVNASQSVTLTLASLTQANKSTLIFAGGTSTTGLLGGGNDQVMIASGNDSNVTAALVGGGGTAGTTTISIVPWAAADSEGNLSIVHDYRADGGLVTYTSAGGFRVLASSEYATALGANATDNVMLTTTTTLGASATANALYLAGSGASLTLTGKTLTLTSGVLVEAIGSFTSGIIGGTIDFGSRTGYAYDLQGTVSSVFTGSGGLVLSAYGTNATTLTGLSTYTGGTYINAGKVIIGATNALPTSTALYLGGAGVLLNNSGSVSQQVASLSGIGTIIVGATNKFTVGGANGTNQAVEINSGGILSPGDPSGSLQAGTLILGGTVGTVAVTNLVFDVGSIFNVDIASATQNDLVSVINGSVVINGGSIVISSLNGYTGAVGSTYDIMDASGGITGSFSSVTSGYSLSIVGNSLILTLVAVPEPSTWMLGLMGLLILALCRLPGRRLSSPNHE